MRTNHTEKGEIPVQKTQTSLQEKKSVGYNFVVDVHMRPPEPDPVTSIPQVKEFVLPLPRPIHVWIQIA